MSSESKPAASSPAPDQLDAIQDEMGMAQSLSLAPDREQWLRWRKGLADVAAHIADLEARLAEMSAVFQECAECDGAGWVVGSCMGAAHHPNCDGSCRHCPVPVEQETQETCGTCHGTRYVSTGELAALRATVARLEGALRQMSREYAVFHGVSGETLVQVQAALRGGAAEGGTMTPEPIDRNACPETGERNCPRCSGEYCDTHYNDPCECDTVQRHAPPEVVRPGAATEGER